ncbi:putative E3 ubiquitin-protein ligase [Tetrabaena socialis]|uniref:HECT-type E3 ubiquitin transferase n=1 Tax=Tetrabaena socialis TaxID=47790 RepID=A0A2J7ZGP9_9CHLO|nr:putative E3 ubiquitin-protein ligase [Tetrabaena socialis]|eukprot:PNG99442.1 putative E3 ubiquitin-protein ligase [Tetrabaena socialis]
MMDFAGRVIGLAMKLNIPLGVHLSTAAFGMMTSANVSLPELEELDPAYYRTCSKIWAAKDDAAVSAMGLDGFRSPDGIELFPGGGDVIVTAENRHDLVNMLALEYMMRSRASALAMMDGIMHVLHNEDARATKIAICRMSTSEFNGMVGGALGDLSTAEWRAHTSTEFVGCEPDEAVTTAFFEMIESMSQPERMNMLRFWTGLHSLPSGGFASLPRQLQLVFRPDLPGRLPSVHTCMMLLDVPVATPDQTVLKTLFTTALSVMEFTKEEDA